MLSKLLRRTVKVVTAVICAAMVGCFLVQTSADGASDSLDSATSGNSKVDSKVDSKMNSKVVSPSPSPSPSESKPSAQDVGPQVIQQPCPTSQSGSWGTNTWSVSEDGGECVLHLTGTNAPVNIRPASDRDTTNMPWIANNSIRDAVTKVSVDSDLTVTSTNSASTEHSTGMFSSMPFMKTFAVTDGNTLTLKDSAPSCMFSASPALSEVEGRFDVSGATDIDHMFSACSGLSSLDLSGWQTGSVTNMQYMFSACSGLSSLDLSGWQTGSVTNMFGVFSGCSSLTELAVSGWDVSSVTDMGYMFSACSGLSSLDLSWWRPVSVMSMSHMFSGCSKLSSLLVSSWRPGNVTSMGYMFEDCSSLVSLDVSNWDVGNVQKMGYMFSDCSKLSSLLVSGWRPVNVQEMQYMFEGCSSLPSLDVSQWGLGKVQKMDYMFQNCSALESLDAANWQTGNVTAYYADSGRVGGMDGMFDGCSSLVSLDASGWDVGRVAYMRWMFRNCSALVTLKAADWRSSNVTNMTEMFKGCSSLVSLPVSGWDVSNVADFSEMFRGCSELSELPVSGWVLSGYYPNMDDMFNGCSSLVSLPVSGWDVSKITSMDAMFEGCSSLVSLDVSDWQTGNVSDMGEMFSGCSSLASLDVSKWQTGNVTKAGDRPGDMYAMFKDCSKLSSLNVSDWDVGKVTNMGEMFKDCSSLASLDVSKWNVSKVEDMPYMFQGCKKMRKLDLSGWDLKSPNMYYTFPTNESNTAMMDELILGPKTALGGSASMGMSTSWYIHDDSMTGPSATPADTRIGRSSDLISKSIQPGGAPGHYFSYDAAVTLHLDANGGFGQVPDDIYGRTNKDDCNLYGCKPGTLTAPALDNLSLLGHVSDGWNTKADGSGSSWAAGSKFYLPAGTTTLYAKWRDVPPVVSLDGSQFGAGEPVSGVVYDQSGSTSVEPGDTVVVTWPDGTTSATTSDSGGKFTFTGEQSAGHGQGNFRVIATDSGSNDSEPAQAKLIIGFVRSLASTGGVGVFALVAAGVLLAVVIFVTSTLLRRPEDSERV